jgi:asparagine synthetase B (glutamine-hydrolysing)
MCGYYFSTNDSFEQSRHPRLAARGPDSIHDLTVNGMRFVHTHLAVFSEIHNQPHIDNQNEIVVLFNGEIYNAPSSMSETQFITDLYLSDGLSGFQKLDGEFAIVLVDFKAGEICLASDPFGTKPCFFSKFRGFHVASYPSSLIAEGCPEDRIEDLGPNMAYRFSIRNRRLIEARELVDWNLDQTDHCFDSWIGCFDAAVAKRAQHMRPLHVPFVGVSSGFDSGAIHASLLRQKLPFIGISILGRENESLIFERQKLSHEAGMRHLIIDVSEAQNACNVTAKLREELVEDLPYEIRSDSREIRNEPNSVLGDKAAVGLSVLAHSANQLGSVVCLSGSGSDETISDYGFGGRPIYQHSNFGGQWPQNLSTIFPWASFYGSTQRSYLRKEEVVGGAFGIETRYPFLDKAIVQSYLALSATLKNSCYKAPLSFFLKMNHYPFVEEKKGFSPW